jgi:hypothetical protein
LANRGLSFARAELDPDWLFSLSESVDDGESPIITNVVDQPEKYLMVEHVLERRDVGCGKWTITSQSFD